MGQNNTRQNKSGQVIQILQESNFNIKVTTHYIKMAYEGVSTQFVSLNNNLAAVIMLS